MSHMFVNQMHAIHSAVHDLFVCVELTPESIKGLKQLKFCFPSVPA